MKKLWLLIPFLLIIDNCVAQSRFTDLINNSYYSVHFERTVSEIKISNDSLFFDIQPISPHWKQKHYQIVGTQIKNNYIFIDVKLTLPASQRIKLPPSLAHPYFGVFVFSIAKDKTKLFSYNQDNMEYTSLADAQKAYADIDLTNKYFLTWYIGPDFRSYTQYPDLKTAENPTMQKVFDDLMKEVNQNSDKRDNSRKMMMVHLGDYWLDNLTKALVKNQLSPIATIIDFDDKLSKAHIVRPPQIPGPQIVIESPIGH